MSQSDIFVRAEEMQQQKVRVKPQAQNNVESNNHIPSGYAPVKLNSLGRLETPALLHFRNYTIDDLLEISSLSEDRFLLGLINCLNGMNLEGFDCKRLHENELIEILMTIHLSFWGKELSNIPFYKDEKLDSSLINSEWNVDHATIDLTSLKTIPIKAEFKEPFKLSLNENQTFWFRLPKVNNTIEVNDYIQNKYQQEEAYYSDFVALLKENSQVEITNKKITESNKTITEHLSSQGVTDIPLQALKEKQSVDLIMLKEYTQYLENRIKDYTLTYTKSLVCLPDKDLNLLEKLDYLKDKKIDPQIWGKWNEVNETYSKFGVEQKAPVFKNKEGNLELRRLLLQYMDFIPSLESQNNSRVNVSFS